MVGLTSLITNNPPMLPKLNRKRALFVLTKIDEILAWEQRKEAERDTRFVDLGRYLCEVRAGQYWRMENLKSFDEFLERRFPESRRTGLLPDVHPRAPAAAGPAGAEAGGLDQGAELAKVARSDGQGLRLCNLDAQSTLLAPRRSSSGRWRRTSRVRKPNRPRSSTSRSTRAKSR